MYKLDMNNVSIDTIFNKIKYQNKKKSFVAIGTGVWEY